LLSNILLTPFDKEMRQKGYRLTRWADDWVVTCRTRAEAEHALARAGRILETLGVTLNREKTRIVHIAQGFEFLGFKIGRGKGRFKLTRDRIKSKLSRQNRFAIPTQKSVDRFKDQIRALTMRRIPLRLGELIETINPIIRGWGNYYCRSHVRKRFHQLDGWIIRRLWTHRAKRWRNAAWKEYPTTRLRTEFKLVGAGLTDTFASGRKSPFMKAGCGKTARPVCAADGGQRKGDRARLLRPDRWSNPLKA
jgi:RNA-directed DNA polymerase